MFVAIYSSINRERAKEMSEEHRSWERFIGWISHSVLHAYFIKENFENRSRIDKILLLKFLSRNNFHFFHIKLILSIFSKFFEEKYKYLEKRINSLETSFYENRIREIKTSNARSTSISTSIALIRAGYRNGEKETERGGGRRSEPRVGNTGRIDASGPRSQGLAWRRRCSKLGTCLAREEGGGVRARVGVWRKANGRQPLRFLSADARRRQIGVTSACARSPVACPWKRTRAYPRVSTQRWLRVPLDSSQSLSTIHTFSTLVGS